MLSWSCWPSSASRPTTRPPHGWRANLLAALLAAATLTACGTAGRAPVPPDTAFARRVAVLLPVDLLLLGEQHDAAEHHVIEFETVDALAARGRLGALIIEMADAGTTTAALPAAATEDEVRAALAWNEQAWPWRNYGAAVMAAVQAHVPVVGGNLPRIRMREAMADTSIDARLDDTARAAQQAAVREGHCGLLPEAQVTPMTRVQIARDRTMAQMLVQAHVPGKTVLLIAGAAHVERTLGVPRHLPAGLTVKSVLLKAGESGPGAAGFDAVWQTPELPARDYCAELRPKTS
ncbi:ChaN family lipoprotein [Variovorax ginsengisoli]|uniref:Iron-regulated protein n=1 Tax=Variovorax ginsengisoli TaxID=363844 RepID=A0ABT9SBU4_9BURK|nr:ChaN family lipoprotein [Variovorax ginsengisoli]MDP9901246.1 putative iron-regulated protein [Variovorax ginsengisoli]